MNRETIENKAKEQAEIYMVEAPYQSGPLGSYRKGFIEGANWRINSVWHDANKEIPIPFRPILVEHYDGKFSVNMVAGNMQSCPMAWLRWAYVSDLLPDRKEDYLKHSNSSNTGKEETK